jgi:hypothetical protein
MLSTLNELTIDTSARTRRRRLVEGIVEVKLIHKHFNSLTCLKESRFNIYYS